jgi:hypothetical protein
VDDAASGGHPVDVTRPNGLVRSEAVAVNALAVEQVGHRREADMRMRPHINALPRSEIRGRHVIKEDEQADQALRRRRQHASDG